MRLKRLERNVANNEIRNKSNKRKENKRKGLDACMERSTFIIFYFVFMTSFLYFAMNNVHFIFSNEVKDISFPSVIKYIIFL